MVFVIQNSQNRDSKAVHIKLDELIQSIEGARNRITLAELESEEEQERDIEELTAKAERAASISARAEGKAKRAAGKAQQSARRAGARTASAGAER
jgi:low affinity Fe/Cu permease